MPAQNPRLRELELKESSAHFRAERACGLLQCREREEAIAWDQWSQATAWRDTLADKRILVWDYLQWVRKQLKTAGTVSNGHAARLGREESRVREELSITTEEFNEACRAWECAMLEYRAAATRYVNAFTEYMEAQGDYEIALCDSAGWEGVLTEMVEALAAA